MIFLDKLLRITITTNSLITVTLREFFKKSDLFAVDPARKVTQFHEISIQELQCLIASCPQLHDEPVISFLIDSVSVYLRYLKAGRNCDDLSEAMHVYLTLLIKGIEHIIKKGSVVNNALTCQTTIN